MIRAGWACVVVDASDALARDDGGAALEALRGFLAALDGVVARVAAAKPGAPAPAGARAGDRCFFDERLDALLRALRDEHGVEVMDGPDALAALGAKDALAKAAAAPARATAPLARVIADTRVYSCLLYTSPSPRDRTRSRMPSSA